MENRKMKRTYMARRVLMALLAMGAVTGYWGGSVSATEQLSSLDKKTPGAITGTYKGNENLEVTILGKEYKPTEKVDNAILLVQGGTLKSATITISNAKTFNVINDNEANSGTVTDKSHTEQWGIAACGGSTISFINIDTVNIGTKDYVTHINQAGLFASKGKITFNNINDFNLNVQADGLAKDSNNNWVNNNANAIMAQQESTISVNATDNVNIQSDGYAVNSVLYGDNDSKVDITGKSVHIISTENGGVWSGNSGHQNNQANVTITGTDNVMVEGGTNGPAVLVNGNTNATAIISGGSVYLGNSKSSPWSTVNVLGGELTLNQVGENGKLIINGTASVSQSGTLNLSSEHESGASESSGNYKVNTGGKVNFKGGVWTVNSWEGDGTGIITVGDDNAKQGTTLVINQAINANQFTLNEQTRDGLEINLAQGGSINVKDYKNDKAVLSVTHGVNLTGAERNQTYTPFTVNGKAANPFTGDVNNHMGFKDRPFLKFTYTDGILQTSVDEAAVDKYLSGSVITNVVKKANGQAGHFFDTKVGNVATNVSPEVAVASLNSLANMGEVVGVTHGTYKASQMMTGGVEDHLSLATHEAPKEDLWATYIHHKEHVNGLSLGGIGADYDTTYHGFLLGSDFYHKDNVIAGVAFTYLNSHSSNSYGVPYLVGEYAPVERSYDASHTRNDADMYGISLYSRVERGDSAYIGDISYLHSKNDVTHYNLGEKITASPKVDAFSVGIKAETSYDVGEGELVPYAGFRYMRLNTKDYTNSLGMTYDVDGQNLFLLPVGISYSLSLERNNWTFKPYAKVGYLWTLGDRKTDQTVTEGASDTFGFETADAGSFIAELGLKADSDRYSYGFGYAYQKGSSVKSNQWMVNVSYKF